MGFNPSQVQEYVARTVKNEIHVKEIQTFIEDNTIIVGLLQLPVQLDATCATCFTWGEDILPMDAKTMTILYEAIEVKRWREDMVQTGKSGKPGLLDDERAKSYRLRSQIETIMGDEVKLVELIAFNGLLNNVIEFHPRHRDALYRLLPEFNDSMLGKHR
ncbi:hypothetical protein N7517_004745 [Penicillium concentricum]|uniref:DUF7068 domain-containing protein n=1 Tax=Penicillium concentricum TaxID=293559 RepID=A0A9W9S8U1_9EURO|nr:uncharacterized protein N7517_004745 [Penicillium concentricum]KAJ5372739.1 hypothetical protein N7517_004745 [Penicillium concentricum]